MNLFKIPSIMLLFDKVCVQVKPQSTNSEVAWKVKVMLYTISPGVFAEANRQKD